MTPRQQELLTFIRSQIESTGTCPTYQQMLNAIGGSSKSSVHGMVMALVDHGHLVCGKSGSHRALRLPTPNLRAVPYEALIAELQRRGEEMARW